MIMTGRSIRHIWGKRTVELGYAIITPTLHEHVFPPYMNEATHFKINEPPRGKTNNVVS